jgi:hypothetical protein
VFDPVCLQYFAAVKENPVAAQTLLGLFAVNLGKAGQANGDGSSFIALSVSCDGVSWAPFTILIRTRGSHGRTYDQPVDGFSLRGGTVHFFVHRDVAGISPRASTRSRIVRYAFSAPALANITRAARDTLPGCSMTSAGVQ